MSGNGGIFTEGGIPKYIFTPKTFDPKPTWLKKPWSQVEWVFRKDAYIHANILRHGEAAFLRHLAEVEKIHVDEVRSLETQLDEEIAIRLKELKKEIEAKFQKLIADTLEEADLRLKEKLAEALRMQVLNASKVIMEEEKYQKAELGRKMEEQKEDLQRQKREKIEEEENYVMLMWDGYLEKIRIFEEHKTRAVHREDVTEIAETIWRQLEFMMLRMAQITEAARLAGLKAFAREAADKARRMAEAGMEAESLELTDEEKAARDRMAWELKLMQMNEDSKNELNRLKEAMGDVIKERLRAESNLKKVMKAWYRFVDLGLGMRPEDVDVDQRFQFLLTDPVYILLSKADDSGVCTNNNPGGEEKEMIRLVDGCFLVWDAVKDWTVERVKGVFQRTPRWTEEELEAMRREEMLKLAQEEAAALEDANKIKPEDVAWKIFDNIVKKTVNNVGEETVAETVRLLFCHMVDLLVSEEMDEKIAEELREIKKEIVRGELDTVATDWMPGERLIY